MDAEGIEVGLDVLQEAAARRRPKLKAGQSGLGEGQSAHVLDAARILKASWDKLDHFAGRTHLVD
jgi:hypothetical protein